MAWPSERRLPRQRHPHGGNRGQKRRDQQHAVGLRRTDNLPHSRRGGSCDGLPGVVAAPAGPAETDHQQQKQDRQGDDGIPQRTVRGRGRSLRRMWKRGDGIVLQRPAFGGGHRSEIATGPGDHQNEDHEQQRIEPVGQRSEERAIRVLRQRESLRLRQRLEGIADEPHLEADPGRDDGQSRDGCGGGVDQERQFLAGDALPIGDGPHGTAEQQGVGVVVEEDDQTQPPGGDLCPPTRAGEGCQPFDQSRSSAAARDDADQATQEQCEEHNLEVRRIGEFAHDDGVDGLQESTDHPQGPTLCGIGEQNGPGPDGQEQGDEHIPQPDGQSDRQYGRDETDPRSPDRRNLRERSRLSNGLCPDREGQQQTAEGDHRPTGNRDARGGTTTRGHGDMMEGGDSVRKRQRARER